MKNKTPHALQSPLRTTSTRTSHLAPRSRNLTYSEVIAEERARLGDDLARLRAADDAFSERLRTMRLPGENAAPRAASGPFPTPRPPRHTPLAA